MINHADRIEQLRGEWEALHKASRLKSPFLTTEYLQLWYSCFARPEQVRIYRAVHDGETIGFLPLVLKSKGPIRCLSSLTNDHCLHSESLVKEGCEDRFPDAILRSLLDDSASWNLLRYSFSNSYSTMPGMFADELLGRSGVTWRRDTQPTFLVSLHKSFDDYFKTDLSANFRKNMKMCRKRLQRAGESQVQHLTGKAALHAWPDFVRIEGSGWKGRTGSSIDSLETKFQKYYQGLVEILADRNALHMYLLVVESETVAGTFCYREGDVLHCAKSGYLEEHGSLSPSNLLLLDIIKDMRENSPGVGTVNLFPWSGGYKHRFANVEATCSELVLYSHTLRGRLPRLTHGFKNALRRTPGLLWATNSLRRLVRRTR